MSYFNRKNIFVWLFALLLVLNIAALATIFYQKNYADDMRLLERRHPRVNPYHAMKEDLDLNDDQLLRFKNVMRNHRERMDEARQEMHNLYVLLSKEFTSDKIDNTRIDSIYTQMTSIRKQNFMKTRDLYLELSTDLDEDQKKKLKPLFRRLISDRHMNPKDRAFRHRHPKREKRNCDQPEFSEEK